MDNKQPSKKFCENCFGQKRKPNMSPFWVTMDNNGQQWIAMDSNGQQWTTMDNNG